MSDRRELFPTAVVLFGAAFWKLWLALHKVLPHADPSIQLAGCLLVAGIIGILLAFGFISVLIWAPQRQSLH